MSYKQAIFDYIASGGTKTENLGLEIEHFVVNEEGLQISFDEITKMIEDIGKSEGAELLFTDGHPVGYYNGKYSVSLEPSCQLEISIDPLSKLSVIGEIYDGFRKKWDPVLQKAGYHMENKGNLPLVELGLLSPDDIPLSDKKRYEYMNSYFKNSGRYGKYMMRASASTQVSVDYRSEADMKEKLSVLQRIAPVLMIMMENKTKEDSVLYEGSDKPHLFRIQEWDDLDPSRTGFYPHSMDPDFGYESIAKTVYETPLILFTDQGKSEYVGNKSAKDLEEEKRLIPAESDRERTKSIVEHFLSMGFFHFRIKKYIEIRVADSVPIKKALGYAALLKGIVYSKKNLSILQDELSCVFDIETINNAVEEIEKKGMDAVIYKNKRASEWAAYLKELAAGSLDATEKEYLSYV